METLSLLLKVVWAPGETMFRVSKTPRVLAPLLFLCGVSLASGVVMFTKIDQAEMTIRMIERTPRGAQMPDEVKERMRTQMRSPVTRTFSIVSATLFPAIMVSIVALAYFGVFTLFGREGNLKAFFAITAFAFVPIVFRQLAALVTVFVVPETSIMVDELGSISPAVFLDRDSVSRTLFTAVGMVDLITIWVLILLVIGFKFVTRKSVSTLTRTAGVLSVYMIWVAYRLGLSYLFGF